MNAVTKCSADLGSCCTDAGLTNIISIFRTSMDLIQMIIPIILIVTLIYQFAKLTANPDEKAGFNKVKNRIKAALVFFLLPTIINVAMGLLPVNESSQLSACWKLAANIKEVGYSNSYVEIEGEKRAETLEGKLNKLYESPSYESATQKYITEENPSQESYNTQNYSTNSSSNVSSGDGSELGQSIVNYALKFVGKQYVYGGQWNGEEPYTPTDCSGFVQGVFKHHGIALSRSTSSQWADRSKYRLISEDQIQAGDLVMYSGHVAILTGNGNEIVHASNSRVGVIVSKDYKTRGYGNILGIMRINGVN